MIHETNDEFDRPIVGQSGELMKNLFKKENLRTVKMQSCP